MKIRFFGHAALGLESYSGESLILDPYRSGGFGGKMGYTPIKGDWDWVVITHNHDDHNAKDTLSGAVNTKAEDLEARFKLRRVSLPHDEYDGQIFGGHVDAVCLEIDGFKICHLSDVGCSPSQESIDAIGPVDICFLPTGGFYTVGPLQARAWWKALAPTVTVPIHYKTPSVDLDLEEVGNFLDYFQPEMIQKSSSLWIEEPSDLAKYANILVLEPINQK